MGLFDGITNFLKPISAPLVSFTTGITAGIVDYATGSHGAVTARIAQPDVQNLGQQLFAVGTIASAAVVAGAVVAPTLAGAGGLGALGSFGRQLASHTQEISNFLGQDSDQTVDDGMDLSSDDLSFFDTSDFSDADFA